jgi:hypothetical protein
VLLAESRTAVREVGLNWSKSYVRSQIYVSPAQAFIPPSQSLRFSQYQVTTRKLHGNNIQESIVVPPGVRQVLVGLRQHKHGIQYDTEELSKAGAGINARTSTRTYVLVATNYLST